MIVYFWCQPAEKEEAEEKRRNFLATFSPLPVTVLFSPQTKTHTQPDPIESHVASFSSFSLFCGYRRSSQVEAEKGMGGNKKSLITFLYLSPRKGIEKHWFEVFFAVAGNPKSCRFNGLEANFIPSPSFCIEHAILGNEEEKE